MGKVLNTERSQEGEEMKPLDVLGISLESTSGIPLLLLREHDAPHRVLPIFIGEPEALAIAVALSDDTPLRPLTHDLLAVLLENLDAHVDHVEVTEVTDGTFRAEVSLRGRRGAVTIDSRPSDAIALALRVAAPLFASDAVLDEASAVVSVEADDAAIDEKVDRFRSFLDEVDPADFGEPEPGT
jgi:bifunctional DNase/RNase